MEAIKEKWDEKYPNSMKVWVKNWDVITPIFKFSADVRKVIYTTYAKKKTVPIFHGHPLIPRFPEKISA